MLEHHEKLIALYGIWIQSEELPDGHLVFVRLAVDEPPRRAHWILELRESGMLNVKRPGRDDRPEELHGSWELDLNARTLTFFYSPRGEIERFQIESIDLHRLVLSRLDRIPGVALQTHLYDGLRQLQFELDEIALDQNLEIARLRLARVRRRLANLILTAEQAE